MSKSKKAKAQPEALQDSAQTPEALPEEIKEEKTVALPKGLRKFDKFKKPGGTK